MNARPRQLAQLIALGTWLFVAHTIALDFTIPRLSTALTIESFAHGPIDSPMVQVTGFTQRRPRDGDPASRKTIAYLGYDQDALHVVFLTFEDPAAIRASLSPREQIRDDDTIGIMIDAFNDQRRAYSFTTNALGVQRDQFYVEGGKSDSSYDTVWQSSGQLTDWGYVVMMSIPFKSLRFSPQSQQSWGIVLNRGIEHLHEFNTWPHISSSESGYLNQAATASGIEDVSPGGSLLVIPYATASSISGLETDGAPSFVDNEFAAKAGVDIKKVWKDSIVTDLTINPDFSQVESDEPQVTVNQRFAVFFPEQRPFFLENADIFRTPYNLLFTRRIIDPELGLRLTGKVGPWAVGAFIIDDEAPGQRLPANHPDSGERAIFAAARVSRDVGEQSTIGAIAVQRTFADDSNLVAGVDGRVKWDDLWTSDFQAVGSQSVFADMAETRGEAIYADINRDGRHFDYRAKANFISDDFDAQAGFVTRTGIISLEQDIQWSYWPRQGPLVEWKTSLEMQYVADDEGERLDEVVGLDFGVEFPGQTEIDTALSYGREKLTREEFPTLMADRDYNTDSVSLQFETAWWKSFKFQVQTEIGNSINFRPLPGFEPRPAEAVETEVEFTYRPATQLTIDASATFTTLDDEATGNKVFDDVVAQMRFNWQFSRALSLRAIVQHERTDPNPMQTTIADRENWNYDLLFTYRVNPWTAVYLGYNTNRANLAIEDFDNMRRIVRTDDLSKDSEQWLLKVSYLFSR